ncbi:ribonuclease H-like domain-containing protein [Tanacetum coccineum]
MSTVGCLIAVVVKNKWPLFQLDVNNAVMYGELEEYVHMKILEGFKVLESHNAIYLRQRKYCIDLLHEFGMLGCKPTSIPMEPNTVQYFKVSADDPSLDNLNGSQKLKKLLPLIKLQTFSPSTL